jgi:hypothetical protein
MASHLLMQLVILFFRLWFPATGSDGRTRPTSWRWSRGGTRSGRPPPSRGATGLARSVHRTLLTLPDKRKLRRALQTLLKPYFCYILHVLGMYVSLFLCAYVHKYHMLIFNHVRMQSQILKKVNTNFCYNDSKKVPIPISDPLSG